MEAKNTVIPVLDHSEGIVCPHCGEEFGIENTIRETRTEQAGISFQAGIREVVEWIKANRTTATGIYGDAVVFYEAMWQAQLKKWGVDKPATGAELSNDKV